MSVALLAAFIPWLRCHDRRHRHDRNVGVLVHHWGKDMSFNGSGTFQINSTGNPVVTGTVISSTWLNALTADLGTGLSTAICKDGQTTVTANIPFAGFKVTGVGLATTTGDALSYGRNATVAALTTTGLATLASLSISGTLTISGAGTYTATQDFQGSASTFAVILSNALEKTTIIGTAPPSTVTFDALGQGIVVYTTNAANNWTTNIRGTASTTLDACMSVGQSVTLVVDTTQGGTAYYNTAVQIDGNAVTPKWQGGAPTAGSINGDDIYSYWILKTGSATFRVRASVVSFT